MADAFKNAGLQVVLIVLGIGSVVAQESPEAWVETIQTPQYVALYVEDIDRSVAWYRAAFGLRPLGGAAADDGSWRIENLGNEHLLVELIRDGRAEGVERALGFRKVGFYVPDVKDVAERIARATGERPRVVDFKELNQQLLQIRDPDGNIFQLLSALKKQK